MDISVPYFAIFAFSLSRPPIFHQIRKQNLSQLLLTSFCNRNCIYWSLPTVPQRRQWQPTPVLLPGKSHGWRSLVGHSPWGCQESDTTEWLHFHFSLSCIGEGNGNPLWCSCLDNPRNGGAWWAAVYGVAQSRTRLKRLSSSSSSTVSGTNVLFCTLLFQTILHNFILNEIEIKVQHLWDYKTLRN